VAEPLTVPVSADIVFACPIIDEVAPSVLVGPFVGAGLQGWFRRLGPGGVVERRIPEDLTFLAPCRIVFLSAEDVGDAKAVVVPKLRSIVPIVVITDGVRGATVFADDTALQVPIYRTREVDPTGAGDVFAAAFLIALHGGEPLAAAARFGAAAASIVVEAVGPSALVRLGETAARAATLQ
jgi:sugar/nucleoside kinase (ribokinase family)